MILVAQILLDLSRHHFQTCKDPFLEISRSSHSLNLLDNAHQLRKPLEFDEKMTSFFIFLCLSLFLSPIHSFWKPGKILGPFVQGAAIISTNVE